MSFTDRLLLWFHIGFVIFAIGPVTIATMSTPRYIRARNVGVLRYLSRMTRVFGAASLGVLLFGIIAGQSLHEMTKTWVTASMTLFVVALVLLLLIMRDQHRAIVAVEGSLAAAAEAPPGAPVAPAAGAPTAAAGAVPEGAEPTAADVEPAPAVAAPAGGTATATAARVNVATVERGRIASLAGVVSLIWLVILVLMVWQP
jgi:predicted lipid-binding transport protein (Tim44 family)